MNLSPEEIVKYFEKKDGKSNMSPVHDNVSYQK